MKNRSLQKAPISPRKVEANRQNAKKSTGPKTIEGKEKSRRNAIQHGFCSSVIDMPDQDPDRVAERMDAWDDALNPKRDPVDGFLVGMAVRSTFRLERCDLVHNARVAKLARDAVVSRSEGRLREVEECKRIFFEEPDVAVRRLKLIPEGIDHLISEWDRLRTTLIGDPPHWDVVDQNQFMSLKGILYKGSNPGPCPTALCTLAIVEHREVKTKLSVNERLEMIHWSKKYSCDEAHQFDKDRYPELQANGRSARDELIWLIGREVDSLRTLKAKQVDDDLIDLRETSSRSRFDASDDGKLLHRYEVDIERSLMRTLKEIRDRAKEAMRSPQVE